MKITLYSISRRFFLLSFLLFSSVAMAHTRSEMSASASPLYTGAENGHSSWQQGSKPSYVGLRLGINAPTVHFRGVGGVPCNSLCGLNTGVVYGIRLARLTPLFFETGMLYTEKGVKVSESPRTEKIQYKMRYLEYPFVVKYKIDTGFDDFTIQPFLGGFFAIGIAGETRYYESREKLSTFRHNLFRVPDVGLRFGCGMAFRNFYFEMSYDVGMMNVARSDFKDFGYDDFDNTARTGNFSATIGVDF